METIQSHVVRLMHSMQSTLLQVQKPVNVSQMRFDKIRKNWERFNERQAVWSLVHAMWSDDQHRQVVEDFANQCKTLADAAEAGERNQIGCRVDLTTFAESHSLDRSAHQTPLNKHGLTHAINDCLDEDGQKWFIGFVRGRCADLAALKALDICPSDVRQLVDVAEQFQNQMVLLSAWCAKNATDAQVIKAEERQEFFEIESGLATGTLILSPHRTRHIRQQAYLLNRQMDHSSNTLARLVCRPYYGIAPLGEDREECDGRLAMSLRDWQIYGIDSIEQLLTASQRNRGPRPQNLTQAEKAFPIQLPRYYGAWDKDNDQKQALYAQIFGLTQYNIRSFPRYQWAAVDVMYERIVPLRACAFEQKKWQDNPTSSICIYDYHELQLFGRIMTKGEPVVRQLFWLCMKQIKDGAREPTNYYRTNYALPDLSNNTIVMRSAAALIAAGCRLDDHLELVEYGRAGVRRAQTNEPHATALAAKVLRDGLSQF